MEKVKLSQIRAQFPMYAEVPDADLIGALHKKFYSTIPRDKFIGAIDFDTGKQDPTADMNGLQTYLAGMGKSFVDVGRGFGQLTGLTSREDVRQSRELDAPLMKTGAGIAGNISGNVAAMVPAAFIPGAATLPGAAAIGAATGLAATSTSTEETLKNTALGGVLSPAALLAGRGVSAAWQGGKALLEPFTKGGQEKIAARTLQQFATDPARAAANLRSAKPLVPGSLPTMAQGADDAGLAQLERTLMNNPETGGKLAEQYAAQRAARMKAINDVAGTDEYYNAIKAGRDVFAKEDYSKAMQQGLDPEMAKALAPQIQSLMGRPSIQEAKKVAMSLARENDMNINNFGSVEGMDWLKKGLDNIISKASQPGSAVGDAKLRALMQTKNDLMSVIEQVSPAYKAANDSFAGMSRQVNSMDVARSLRDKYEPALSRFGANTRENANAYATALESAQESVKKATGMNLPMSKVMNTGDADTLTNIARDLARKAKAEDMGRAVGSNTAQNLAGQNLLRRTLGPTGLPQSWSESQALQNLASTIMAPAKLVGAQDQMLQRLLQATTDPQDAAALLMLARQQGGNGLLSTAQPVLPALTGGGLLSYRAQQ